MKTQSLEHNKVLMYVCLLFYLISFIFWNFTNDVSKFYFFSDCKSNNTCMHLENEEHTIKGNSFHLILP